MISDDTAGPAPRRTNGQFPAGQSGNPKGRPKGEIAVWREELAMGGHSVVQAVLLAAQCGDMNAARIVLDRLLPALKPTSQTIRLDLPEKASPLQIATALMEAAANGLMPAETAAQLITAASSIARIEENDELKARIEALERAVRGTNEPSPKPRK